MLNTQVVQVGVGSAPPYCEKHKEQMALYFYDRPGSVPGNGWSCRSCTEERKTGSQVKATRFPEGAEL